MKVRVGSLELAGSVSIGVAARTEGMADIDALIKAADEGVYVVKQRGRDGVATIQQGAIAKNV
jgi:PleD family two-component response regulator